MALKETPKSLRLYFGVIATLSFYLAAAIAAQGVSPLVLVFSIANAVFGALYAYITIKFPVLLPMQPSFIKRVLGANLIFSVAGFALSLSGGLQIRSVATLILGVLIYVYLVRSVVRLSGETNAQNA